MSERTETGSATFWGDVDDAEALERYRALVDAVDDGIYQLDSDGRILGVNETVVERTGFAREELLGEHFSALLDVTGADRVGGVIGDLVETGGPGRVETVECPVRIVDGESVDCEHRLTKIPESAVGGGGVTGVVRLPEPGHLVEDEPAPTPLDDTFAGILNEADTVGVFVLDADFHVAWIDETIEQYFGLDRQSVVDRDKRQLVEDAIADCIEDEETFTETVFATYDDNSSLEQFECHVTPGDDREERWLEHLSKPIDSGPYAGGRVELYYDVTEQHRRAYQLRQLNEAVREWLSETSREAVAERACAHLTDILDLEINGVFLHEPATDELRPAALSEPGKALIEEPPTFTTKDSIAGRVYETGEAVVYDDVTSDPDVYNPDTPIRSEIVLPIGDHGVVVIGSEARDAFDDGDLMLAKVVASSLESTFDRISHERQLERERDLVDRILETSPVGIQVIDADGEVTRMNERLTELLDVDDADDYDPSDRQAYDDEGVPIPVDEHPFARTLATGEPVYDAVLQIELPGGERRWLSVNATPVLTDDGTIDRVVTSGQDVTALKERERRLERQRDDLAAELEEIYGRITDGFVALNEDWELTHLNERAAEILGVDEDELLGEIIWDARPEIRDSVFEERYREAMATQESKSFVAYHDRTDAWYEEHVYPSETGLSVYFRDVTERKEIERELRESERRFRQIAENIEAVVWLTPPDRSEMTYVNPAYEEIWGRSRESVYEDPTSFLAAIHPEDRDRVQEALETQVDGEYDEEYRVVQPDGDVRWVRDRAFPIEDDGEIYRLVGIAEDITERKKREQELERSERRYRTLAEYFPKGIVTLFDRDLRYELAAGSGFDRISLDPADVIGNHFREVWDDEIVAALEPAFQAALDGEEASVELTTEGRDWIVHTVPITDERGEVFAGMTMGQDITDQKERERRLEELVDKLEESNERLEQFAYAASHDLQEPLRMVSSYLQLLERRYSDELDADAEEFLDFAVDGADRMREMIDGLLEYSRVDTRGTPLAPVDLEAVLADVREDLRLQIRETDAEISAENLPRVEGDPSQLRQVFQNLLENAIEYSGDEPPRVHVGAERDGDQWMVSVTDQGIGIDPDDQERVFEVFQRLHTREEHEGTGIGLALCERIVERHDGDIWIDSEPGEGTTFSVTLPAADGSDA